MTRTALIAGATGLVGSSLLQLLLADKRYRSVTVLARRPMAQQHEKLTALISDFSDLAGLGAQLAADDVYCCLGTTLRAAGSRPAFEQVDFHHVVNLARAAKNAGAKRFLVVSAAGASATALAYYSRVKARMETAVSEIGFEATHILRPSLLLGARMEHRPGEYLAQKTAPVLTLLLRGPLRKYQPIEARAVAQSMCELAWEDARGVQVHSLPL